MNERISRLLQEIRPESDFAASKDFLGDGLLDSFDMIALVASLDTTFRVSIEGVDIVPQNFQNLDAIAALLRKYRVSA